MAAQQANDEENKKYLQSNSGRSAAQQQANGNAGVPADGGMGGGTNSSANATYPFQRTFQTQAAPGGTPGQQTPMPWSGMNPQMAGGNGATPWAQAMQAPRAPMQGQQAAPQGMPNWQALAQRFGAPGGATAPSPAFQHPQWGGGQGMNPQQFGGGNPWLQGLLQKFGGAIAGQGGGGMPAWGGGQAPAGPQMQMPNWGGGQGLPIFNIPRNTY